MRSLHGMRVFGEQGFGVRICQHQLRSCVQRKGATQSQLGRKALFAQNDHQVFKYSGYADLFRQIPCYPDRRRKGLNCAEQVRRPRCLPGFIGSFRQDIQAVGDADKVAET